MPSGPFPQLCTTVDGQQCSIDILSMSDDGDALAALGRRPPGPFTEMLLITPPGIPAESPIRRRGPMRTHFLRAGDAKDINVEELGIAPDDGAVLVTVHAPLAREGYTYELFGTYEAPESPPDAPRFQLLGPMLDGVQSRLAPVTLIAWRRRVYCRGTTSYLEVLWHPETRETIALKGLDWGTTQKSLIRVQRGLRLLQAIEVHGGRPPDIEDETFFRQLYWDAYQNVLEEKRRDGSKHPTKTEVAAEMLISTKTLKRQRDRWGLPFPPRSPR